MGKYINTTSTGEHIGIGYNQKIDSLVSKEGAVKIDPPTQWEEGLCCAVNNGAFGAVAYAYDEREMDIFLRDSSGRPKQWLKIPHASSLVDE